MGVDAVSFFAPIAPNLFWNCSHKNGFISCAESTTPQGFLDNTQGVSWGGPGRCETFIDNKTGIMRMICEQNIYYPFMGNAQSNFGGGGPRRR
jgi:hypothetical protein